MEDNLVLKPELKPQNDKKGLKPQINTRRLKPQMAEE